MVAISLGFVCQFVTMLAHYLNVPLRYPLTPMGSRAFVLDPVSLLVGPKEYVHSVVSIVRYPILGTHCRLVIGFLSLVKDRIDIGSSTVSFY